MTELQKKHREKDLKGRQHFLDDYGKYFITAGTEGLYDDFDLFLTALTNSAATYIVEIKNYENADYPRPYTKFDDYQLDYDKVDKLVKIAETEGRIPILYARFEDLTITWDLRDIPYKERRRMTTMESYTGKERHNHSRPGCIRKRQNKSSQLNKRTRL